MLTKAILLFMPIAALGVSGDRAGSGVIYDRCDTTNGPAKWAGACQNQASGTPINLCGAVAFPSPQPVVTVTGYNVARSMTIGSDGSNVVITIPTTDSSPPTLTAGNLSALVGRSTNSSTQIWKLQQMHLHWGRTGMQGSEGSEHYLQGQAYAAEAHFVHYNSNYGTFGAAVASGNKDALLVVGIFLQAGSSDSSATITTMANAVTAITSPSTTTTASFTLSDLYDGTGAFYSYGGSLTTPTCLEIVTWIVQSTPKTVSMGTLTNLWKYTVSPGTAGAASIAKNGNYRPLQTVSGRTVYNSAGATAACTTPTEPTWNCAKAASSSGFSSTPLLSLNIALLLLSYFGFTH